MSQPPGPDELPPPAPTSQPVDLPPPGAAAPTVAAPEVASPQGPSPRGLTVVLCAFVAILCLVVIGLVHAPFAIFAPGPATNLLAPYQGKSLISVSGHPTYPVTGALDFTTVAELGGPGSRLSLFDVLRGWLSPSRTVYPEAEIFPKSESSQQIEQQNQTDMTNSQQDAAVAAMRELGITVPEVITITAVTAGVPAAAVLRKGDVVTSVDGKALTSNAELHAAIQAHQPGDVIRLGLTRAGQHLDVRVKTTKATDNGVTRTVVGLDPGISYTMPFKVTIGTHDVGGPSAGTMFALALYDTLTPGSLTGGQRIAGTGTIDPTAGDVGAIGGIQQKLVGAKNAGAQWFLAPSSNCDEVKGHVPSGLHVVKISTLHQARLDVEKIAAGHGSTLAGCG